MEKEVVKMGWIGIAIGFVGTVASILWFLRDIKKQRSTPKLITYSIMYRK